MILSSIKSRVLEKQKAFLQIRVIPHEKNYNHKYSTIVT